jgi:hypothetical protein
MIHWVIDSPVRDVPIKMSAPVKDEPEVETFIRAFCGVWASINEDHRQSISRFWQRCCNKYQPMFVLDKPWLGGEENLASTEDAGLSIKFDWATLRLYPETVMRNPIAHEMAHVYQWSIGKSRLRLTDDDLQKSLKKIDYRLVGEKGRVELHADEIMLSWGHNPIDGHAWLTQHYKLKNGVAVQRKQPLTKKYARSSASNLRWRIYHSRFRYND